MAFDGKPLSSLTEADLNALIENQVAEDRTLDLKRDFTTTNQEFVKDVCALANTVGGHLVYGVDEENGVATKITPIVVGDWDEEKLRLESALRDCSDPRVPSVELQPVAVKGGHVLVIRVPQSWAGPHMIKGRAGSFVGRAANGVYAMDASQLRNAFLNSESLHSRVKAFRADRIHSILEEEQPAWEVKGAATVVLHLCPLASFTDARVEVDQVAKRQETAGMLAPFGGAGMGMNKRFTFEGLAYYGDMTPHHENQFALTQLFRNGCIEGVNTMMFRKDAQRDGGEFFEGTIEATVNEHLNLWFQFLKSVGMNGPTYLILSLLNVGGFHMKRRGMTLKPHVLDRNRVLLPEILIENLDANPVTALKTAYDVFWNTCNLSRCLLYDEAGNWTAKVP